MARPIKGQELKFLSEDQKLLAENYVALALKRIKPYCEKIPHLRNELISLSLYTLTICAGTWKGQKTFPYYFVCVLHKRVKDLLREEEQGGLRHKPRNLVVITSCVGNEFFAQEKNCSDDYEWVDGIDYVERFIRILPPSHQQPFRLHVHQGISCAEIGKRLGKSTNRMAEIIRESRKMIAEFIEHYQKCA